MPYVVRAAELEEVIEIVVPAPKLETSQTAVSFETLPAKQAEHEAESNVNVHPSQKHKPPRPMATTATTVAAVAVNPQVAPRMTRATKVLPRPPLPKSKTKLI